MVLESPFTEDSKVSKSNRKLLPKVALNRKIKTSSTTSRSKSMEPKRCSVRLKDCNKQGEEVICDLSLNVNKMNHVQLNVMSVESHTGLSSSSPEHGVKPFLSKNKRLKIGLEIKTNPIQRDSLLNSSNVSIGSISQENPSLQIYEDYNSLLDNNNVSHVLSNHDVLAHIDGNSLDVSKKDKNKIIQKKKEQNPSMPPLSNVNDLPSACSTPKLTQTDNVQKQSIPPNRCVSPHSDSTNVLGTPGDTPALNDCSSKDAPKTPKGKSMLKSSSVSCESPVCGGQASERSSQNNCTPPVQITLERFGFFTSKTPGMPFIL